MPTSAIVFSIVAGPAMPRPGRVPFKSTCIQADFYGPDLRTAGQLYEQWYIDFFPAQNNLPTGFIAAHTAISSLEQLNAPIALFGGENAWPRVSVTYLVKHGEQAV